MKKIISAIMCLIIALSFTIPAFAQRYTLNNRIYPNTDFYVDVPNGYELKPFDENNSTHQRLKEALSYTSPSRDYYIFQSKNNPNVLFMIATAYSVNKFEVVGTGVTQAEVNSVLNSIVQKETTVKTEPYVPPTTTKHSTTKRPSTTTTTTTKQTTTTKPSTTKEDSDDTQIADYTTTTTNQNNEETTTATAEKPGFKFNEFGLIKKIKEKLTKSTSANEATSDGIKYMITLEGVNLSNTVDIAVTNVDTGKHYTGLIPHKNDGVIYGTVKLPEGTYRVESLISSNWDVTISCPEGTLFNVSEEETSTSIEVHEGKVNKIISFLGNNIIIIILVIIILVILLRLRYWKKQIISLIEENDENNSDESNIEESETNKTLSDNSPDMSSDFEDDDNDVTELNSESDSGNMSDWFYS